MYIYIYIYMEASILYPTPPKIGKKSTGRPLQNEFFNGVLGSGVVTAEFALKNWLERNSQCSKIFFLDPIQPLFHFFSEKLCKKSTIFCFYSHSRGVSHHFRPSLSSLPIGKPQPQLRPPKCRPSSPH